MKKQRFGTVLTRKFRKKSDGNPDRGESVPAPDPEGFPSATDTGTDSRRYGVFPAWNDLLVMIGIFLVASALAGLAQFIIVPAAPGLEKTAVVAITYFIQFALAIIGIYAYRLYRGGKGRVFRFAFKWYNSSLVLLGLVLVITASVVVDPLLNLFPEHYFEKIKEMTGTGGWAVLTTVAVAPILEEMLFRGLILESARAKWGVTKAILISAALFGLVHLNPPQMVNAFVMGIAMGYIYVLTDSLLSVILIHAANNAIAYVMSEVTGSQTTELRTLIGSDVWYYIIYGISLAVFMISLISMAVIASKKARGHSVTAAVPAPGMPAKEAGAGKSGQESASGGNNRH